MKPIIHYLCPDCFSGNPIAQDLRTGQFLTHPDQIDCFLVHSGSHPRKPTGSYFLTPNLGAYETGARQFGRSGWAGFPSSGCPVLLAPFPEPFATMEYFGSGACLTSTGAMVLLDHPDYRHWFGIARIDGPVPTCSGCGRTWP